MNSRKVITHTMGAVALFSATALNAALMGPYFDYASFETAVLGLGYSQADNFGKEGFEPVVGGVDTPWKQVIWPAASKTVSSLGVNWLHTNPDNEGFSVSNMSGAAHQGQYEMLIPTFPSTPMTHDMSYSFEMGSNLVAFGGWFKGIGAKPAFTYLRADGTKQLVEFNATLTDMWSFIGFIDDAGFTRVDVTELEALGPGDEGPRFVTDDITFVSQQAGIFPPPPVPLPAALPLFGSALLGLGFMARRRKKD